MFYNAYEKDIAIVNIFFGDSTGFGELQFLTFEPIMLFSVPEFERLPKMTWLDFISGFGGLCGLCLGISFVSVAEILYWFFIRLCKKFWSTPHKGKHFWDILLFNCLMNTCLAFLSYFAQYMLHFCVSKFILCSRPFIHTHSFACRGSRKRFHNKFSDVLSIQRLQ